MSATIEERYFVIPLSEQQEGDLYVVGNTDLGDFYQFPEQGVQILRMLRSGETPAAIKSRLAAVSAEPVDVDDFLHQLTQIGFIHPESRRQQAQQDLQDAARDSRRTFSVDRRVAKAIFSPPMLACYAAVILYAAFDAVVHPQLRLNIDAFYIETNKTALLLAMMVLSLVQTILHELGHMLAAARQGIVSKYGIGNRMWNIVAESDLTGILTLPKAKRYLPMLAGLLVDALSAALLTILLGFLLRHDAGPFTIQLVQAMILEIVIGMAWQFNVFVKTDIYFVICNIFSDPDLDAGARIYLRGILNRITLGRFGTKAPAASPANLAVLRIFSLVWLFGRILSMLILFGVFLPTMGRYLGSAIQLLNQSPTSVWMACDTILYVAITLTILGTGMYMWIKNKSS